MKFIELVQVIGAGLVAAALAVAVIQVWLTQVNERRRSQGIVIAHESRPRHLAEGGWRVEVYLTNEGESAAFNVCCGVSIYGVRYPFRLYESDPLSGNRQRVVRARERLPNAGSFPIPISSLALFGRGAERQKPAEEGLFYWARYEDAQGRTYETENPPDRSANLKIRRVHFLKTREGWNRWKHRKADESGVKWEEKVRQEFREASAADSDRS